MLFQDTRNTTIVVWLVALAALSISCASNAEMNEPSRSTSPSKAYIEERTEVTISLAFRDGELRRVRAEPETAVIFVRPEDRRLVTEVVWRVECLRDGEVVRCPKSVRETVIEGKEGCSPHVFPQNVFVIPSDKNAIASGEASYEAYEELYKEFQARRRAMMEKDRIAGSALLGCQGDAIRTAPDSVRLDYGITWQYSVTVTLENGEKVVLDPEIWVEKDEGG